MKRFGTHGHCVFFYKLYVFFDDYVNGNGIYFSIFIDYLYYVSDSIYIDSSDTRFINITNITSNDRIQ